MNQPEPQLAAALEHVLTEAVCVIRAELWISYVVDWARAGGRTVPFTYLRNEAHVHGIESRHLDAALRNLHAGTRQVGDFNVIDLPKETTT
jgi:hypothetical protein